MNQKAMTCSDRNQRWKYKKWTTTRTAMPSKTNPNIHYTRNMSQLAYEYELSAKQSLRQDITISRYTHGFQTEPETREFSLI